MKRQTKQVLDYIREHGEITQMTAIYIGCYRLSGRIFELRQEGIPIITTYKTVNKADGSKATIAVYKLEVA